MKIKNASAVYLTKKRVLCWGQAMCNDYSAHIIRYVQRSSQETRITERYCMYDIHNAQGKRCHFNYDNNKPDKLNRRRLGAIRRANTTCSMQQEDVNSVVTAEWIKTGNEWQLVRWSADAVHNLCAFTNIKQSLAPLIWTISTYNIKEALRGIYGVQQLINMVLNEEQRGIRKQADLHNNTSTFKMC